MGTATEVLVETFYLDMASNQCGYPLCCPGDQPHFKPLVFFPAKVTDLGVAESVKETMAEMDKVYHETGMPMFPCLLHHFCLPFSPICAAVYFENKRKRKLDEAIKRWNEDVGLPIGLYLAMNRDYHLNLEQRGNRRTVIVALSPGMEMRMNLRARQEYCMKHNRPFDPEVYSPVVAPVGPPAVIAVAPPPYHTHPFNFHDSVTVHHGHHDLHHDGGGHCVGDLHHGGAGHCSGGGDDGGGM